MSSQPNSPLRLNVRTASGQPLGIVVDISIDPDSQTIVQYHVKPNRLVPDAVRAPLLIHRSQVQEITATELIVDDAVTKSSAPTYQPARG